VLRLCGWKSIATVINVLAHYEKLHTLDLSGVRITENILDRLLDLQNKSGQLKTVIVSDITHYCNVSMTQKYKLLNQE